MDEIEKLRAALNNSKGHWILQSKDNEKILEQGEFFIKNEVLVDKETNQPILNRIEDEKLLYIQGGLEITPTPTTYRPFKDNLNYDELLDQWFELVMKESEKARLLSDEGHYKKPYSFKQGHLRGFADGLIMATSILSNLERKAKRRINNKE